jgi:hypothetical protein
MRYQIFAAALACVAAVASFGVRAELPLEPYPDAAYNGSYVIEVVPGAQPDAAKPSCMIYDAARGAHGVRSHRWSINPGALCGFGDLRAHEANKQAVWDIAQVAASDGRKGYTIRSRVNGQCLIRGNNGTDLAPQLYMWSGNNPQWCGFDSADAFVHNGQAAWSLGDSPTEGANAVSLFLTRTGPTYLSFASRAANMQTGAAIVTDDTAFRFRRVLEDCDNSFAIAYDMIRVCGTGDFARPVRVEEAGYLGLPFESWWAPPGRGDPDAQFAAVTGANASAYCARLRTGDFGDWRVPTPDELVALYHAFPNNALYTEAGWSTGAHLTSERNGNAYTAINLFDGRYEGHGMETPVACIR